MCPNFWFYQMSVISFVSLKCSLQIKGRIKDFFVWEIVDPNEVIAEGALLYEV